MTFSGNPGHGLAFIQNNAAEKMVSILLESGSFRVFKNTFAILVWN